MKLVETHGIEPFSDAQELKYKDLHYERYTSHCELLASVILTI